jgi:hypothetical protein
MTCPNPVYHLPGLVNWRTGGSQVDGTSEQGLPALRTKRCLFHMYAIVCHSAGELTTQDVATVLPKP